MSKFKVGDRVRTKGYEGTHWDGEGTIVSIGGYCNIIVEIDGDRGGFFDHELEPATNTNTSTPTTGFTVPLCAYEDAVTTTALGDAYVAGYKAGLAALQAQAA